MLRIPAFEATSPFGEMNTTPLIDVLLVLLVMFIVTIPIQTHQVKFDLPASRPLPLPNATSNLLVVTAKGSIRWNGIPVDRRELGQELAMTRQMMPAPELHLQPDADARHGDVDEILAIIKREGISRFGFVGNEAYVNVF